MQGGTFYRSYDGQPIGRFTSASDPATVSGFRLDAYDRCNYQGFLCARTPGRRDGALERAVRRVSARRQGDAQGTHVRTPASTAHTSPAAVQLRHTRNGPPQTSSVVPSTHCPPCTSGVQHPVHDRSAQGS